MRKIAVEKKQANHQPQVSIGDRRHDWPLIAAYFRLMLVTSGISLVARSPEWSDLEAPELEVTGDLPVFT